MSDDQPADGRATDLRAAQLVPTNCARVPLYHWRPTGRLLGVGDRDGAAYDGQGDAAAERTFQRDLSLELLQVAQQRAGTGGLLASWSGSLAHAAAMRLLAAATSDALVVATPALGNADVVADLLPQVDAWLLLLAEDTPRPLAEVLLNSGRHVELQLGLDGETSAAAMLTGLSLGRVAAVHLQPRRPTAAVGATLEAWEDAAIATLTELGCTAPVYHSRQRHSVCQHCGETLVWRANGRARAEALDAHGACTSCGAPFAAG